MIEKKHPDNIISTANTIQVTKYDFIPSFKQHKTINLDQNTHYRKFKPNKNPTNMHKMELGKLKKPATRKIPEKVAQSENISYKNTIRSKPP